MYTCLCETDTPEEIFLNIRQHIPGRLYLLHVKNEICNKISKNNQKRV